MCPSGGKAARQPSAESPASITSRDNRWLKRFRAALSGSRSAGEAIGVEGLRLVEAALGSNLTVEAVLASESGTRHLARISPSLVPGVPVLRTSDKLFAGVADTQTPQGIAALVQPRDSALENLLSGTALVVVLVGVQDPGNVGTIIRAAEALGATGVATCPAGGNRHGGPAWAKGTAGVGGVGAALADRAHYFVDDSACAIPAFGSEGVCRCRTTKNP